MATKDAKGKSALTAKTAAPKAAAPATPPETEFKLEGGIAIPARQTAVNKYPFRHMEVDAKGDGKAKNTFRAPTTGTLDKEAATKLGRSIGSAASRFAKDAGKKFTTRVLQEGEGFYVRCWRVE